MRCKSLLVLSCIFKCVAVVLATCIVSKYEEGDGDRVQCVNVTLSTVLDQKTPSAAAIMIFRSQLQFIPEKMFAKYARSLVSLNIHQCRVLEIHRSAFEDLTRLKKLSLPNNNITRVEEQWFKDLISLEQLDLSFNFITNIEPAVFGRLHLLKRLDIAENRMTCFQPHALEQMGGLEKFRFSGNPLSLTCRGKLTLWLRDRGVNYKTNQDKKSAWLDRLLWLCAIDDPKTAESEVPMQECVILNLFNQLRTGLISAASYPLAVPQECSYARNYLTSCITARSAGPAELTNGDMIKRLLLQLREAKLRF